MNNEPKYVSENDTTEANILAAECGELVYWRTAADGVKWFRSRPIHTEASLPEIHGVESGDDIDADDDGVELVDDEVDDPPPTLDDFERSQLREWADEMRRAAMENYNEPESKELNDGRSD